MSLNCDFLSSDRPMDPPKFKKLMEEYLTLCTGILLRCYWYIVHTHFFYFPSILHCLCDFVLDLTEAKKKLQKVQTLTTLNDLTLKLFS